MYEDLKPVKYEPYPVPNLSHAHGQDQRLTTFPYFSAHHIQGFANGNGHQQPNVGAIQASSVHPGYMQTYQQMPYEPQLTTMPLPPPAAVVISAPPPAAMTSPPPPPAANCASPPTAPIRRPPDPAASKHLAVGPDSDDMNEIAEDVRRQWLPMTWVERCSDDQRLQFVCLWGQCLETLRNRDIFVDHLHAHCEFMIAEADCRDDDKNKFTCRVRGCQKGEMTAFEMQRHLTMHIFQADCQNTGSQVLTERDELKHVEGCGFEPITNVHYDGEVLICQWYECGMPFASIPALFDHVTQHIDMLNECDRIEQASDAGDARNVFACRWGNCHLFFEHKGTLRRHVRHHSGEKCLACPFCSRFFSRKDKLYEHVTRRAPATSESTLICKLCQKKFVNERSLCLHVTRHLASMQCPLCGLAVTCRTDLHRHLMIKHSTRSKDQVCEMCDRKFFSESDLLRHSLMHADNQFECNQCSEKFRWKKQLIKHRKSHDENFNASPFVCHICDRTYTTGFSLTRHLIRNHNCPVPDGFSRFQYKKCADGLMRLQTKKLFRRE